MKLLTLALFLSVTMSYAQETYPPSNISFDNFIELVKEVEKIRPSHLLSLDEFLKTSKKSNTIILDARSDFRFERKHLKGASHLAFTDFTLGNLKKLIPDQNTRILIYCNNNFTGDEVDFSFKGIPDGTPAGQILSQAKASSLALNIPTLITLYGYGYKSIYELGELVDVNDKRITFEGTVVLVKKND